MDWKQVQNKWGELISSAKENWGKLTDDDLVQVSGDRGQLTEKIQQTYGISRREADKQVWDWSRSMDRGRKTIA